MANFLPFGNQIKRKIWLILTSILIINVFREIVCNIYWFGIILSIDCNESNEYFTGHLDIYHNIYILLKLTEISHFTGQIGDYLS